ncbi:hypothetical protein C4546_01965 [Candidatus Parcubacteria bacterium]|jgi:hypothetical protein|nr:MAG: hypothetical protein C4546_01965 [Candidatus Parcubacteria bacterium]
MNEIHPDNQAVRSEIAQTQTPNPEPHNLKQLPPPHIHWLRRILWGLLAVILAVILVFAVGYMRFSWQTGALLWPAKVLPYPVAMIGSHWLSYLDYQNDVPNIIQYLERNETPDASAKRGMPLDVYARKIILNKMVGEDIINRLAKVKNIVINQSDIDNTYKDYIAQAGGNQSEIENYIRTLYNWSVAQFKQKLIRPQVVQNKIAEAYFAEIKKQTEDLRGAVAREPNKFSETAKTQSSDASAAKGGLLEVMNTASLKTAYGEVASAIETLKVGDVSQVLETSRGYEIVYLEKREAAAKQSDGEMFTLRRILKTPNFSVWLQDQVNAEIKKNRVILFEPRFRWEADCGILTKTEPSCTAAAQN